jgi:hypothetical protein
MAQEGNMNQTVVSGYSISEGLRKKMYMVLAMYVKIDNIRHLGECQDRIEIMLYHVLRDGRKVFLYEWERDSVERYYDDLMEKCLRAHPDHSPSEGQESVYLAYGKMFEDKKLGRSYDQKRFFELAKWLMEFELAA